MDKIGSIKKHMVEVKWNFSPLFSNKYQTQWMLDHNV